MDNPEHFLVVGSAQTARNTNLNDVYSTVSIQLYVRKDTKVIEKAHLNVISPLTQAFFEELVTGYCMDDPVKPLLDRIRKHMLTPSTASQIQALRAAWLRYQESEFYNK